LLYFVPWSFRKRLFVKKDEYTPLWSDTLMPSGANTAGTACTYLFLRERFSRPEGLTLLSCSWCGRSEYFCVPNTCFEMHQLLMVWCHWCWYDQPLRDQQNMLCRLLSSKLWWEVVEHPTSLWEVSRSNPWIVMFAHAVSTRGTLFVKSVEGKRNAFKSC
jgi:hypothetical protein